jgi:carboxylesterase type B
MSSNVPLFNKVVLQSGFPSTMSSTHDLAFKDAQYIKLLEYCGIDSNNPDRLSKLRHDISAEKLIEAITALNAFAFTPFNHPTFFPEMPDLRSQGRILSQCDWVDSVIIGDAFFEVRMPSSRLSCRNNSQYDTIFDRVSFLLLR